MNETTSLPTSRIEPAQRRTLAWILPVAALVLAGFLAVQTWGSQGTLITVRAAEGHGIKAGDDLRYRGIEVGRIEEARLSRDLSDVLLAVRLDPAADQIASAGSRFWIVRPRLSLDKVSGLETVVGARHLAVDPGPPGGRRQTEFDALEEPPVVERIEAEGLEITLEATTRHGLSPGAPVTYRQIQVGSVLSVGLSNDATAVELRVYVRPEYVQLVRQKSAFWETGGVELGLSLTEGFRMDLGSLRSLLVGGIAFATPPDAGPLASTGQRFTLHSEAREEWLEWSPPLPVGGSLLPVDVAPPRLLRATLRWKEGRLLTSSEQRHGWLLPVADGLLGPADLLQPSADAHDGTTVLEVGGGSHPITAAPSWGDRGLARVELQIEGAPTYDLARVRELPVEGEECVVFGDPAAAPMALAASRLVPSASGWEVDDAVSFGPRWNGACVLARGDGALIGILLIDATGTRVVPVPRR